MYSALLLLLLLINIINHPVCSELNSTWNENISGPLTLVTTHCQEINTENECEGITKAE